MCMYVRIYVYMNVSRCVQRIFLKKLCGPKRAGVAGTGSQQQRGAGCRLLEMNDAATAWRAREFSPWCMLGYMF